MADNGINPAMLANPDAYYKAQRLAMLSQALTQNAMTPLQAPDAGGRIVARISPFAALSKGLEGYTAGKLSNKAMDANVALAKAMRDRQQQSLSAMGGQGQPNGVSTPDYPQPQQPQQNPYAVAQDADMSGVGPEVTKAYLAAQAPTPEQRNAIFAAGGDQNAARQYLNQGSGGERAGMPRFDKFNHIIGYAPDIANGIGYNVGPNGEPIPYKIQGATDLASDAASQKAFATERGKTLGGPVSVPTAGGGTHTMLGTDYFGLHLPNNGTPASNAPPAPPDPNDKFADIPKLNIPQGVGTSPDVYTKARLEHAASKDAELSDKYGSESDLADQRLAFNNMALNILGNAETGPLADRITKMRAQAQQLGIPESMIPGWAKVAPTQELKKDLVRNALVSLKPTFGARPAASEFQVLKEEANPSDQMTALAIRRLLTVDNESAQYQKQRAEDYGTYSQRGGNPMRFESWYSRKNPVAPRLEAARAGADPSAVEATKTDGGKTYVKKGGVWHEVVK